MRVCSSGKLGPTPLVDRDDLAVHDRRFVAEADVDLGHLGVLERDVVAAAGHEAQSPAVPHAHRADAVPLGLRPDRVAPLARRELRALGRRAGRQHGPERVGVRRPRERCAGVRSASVAEAGDFGRAGGRRPPSRPERTASTRAATAGPSACADASTGTPSGCTRPSMSVFMRCSSQVDFSPSAVRADQRQPHAAERSAGAPFEGGDDLVVSPLLELVPAVVPDRDAAAAVFPGRDAALERRVVHRVVLGHDREVVALVRRRHAPRHRPADQHAVPFEAEVPVQRRRVVLLDHEGRQLAGRRRGGGRVRGHRLGRLSRRPLGDVGAQRAVIGAAAAGVDSERRERIADGLDALEHLVERELREIGVVELLPRPRSGDVRVRTAAQRVRRDRGLRAVVLAPVDQHPPAADRLLHAADDHVGVIGFDGLRQLVGDRRSGFAALAGRQCRVELDALASARHRKRIQAHVTEDVACPSRHLGAFGEPDTRTRVEVEHKAVGIPPRSLGREPPLRHVQLEARDLREVHERGHVADQRVVLRAARVRDRQAVHPVGGAALEVLREERLLGVLLGAHAVGPALAGHRPPGDVRDHRRTDAGVVVDHLALGRARLGVEDLVEVRDAQSPAADADELLLLSTRVRSTPCRGIRHAFILPSSRR